ncbi:MAG: hypothetical protein FJ150_09740 [Euryarchaeota archaeon]|nr:hypothetical protein [Euryarchaeota archaeon]
MENEEKIFAWEILDEAEALSKRLKDYEGSADRESLTELVDQTIELIIKLGKAVDNLENKVWGTRARVGRTRPWP